MPDRTAIEDPAITNPARGLCDLLAWMPAQRRRQLVLLFLLMLAGAVAELMAIGAVLPFLRLIVAPGTVLADPRLAGLRETFGWYNASDLVAPAALLLIACAVIAAAVRLLLTWASQRFIYRVGYDMDAELFRRTVHQPYLVYVNRNGSEILAAFEKINTLTIYLLLPMMIGVASGMIALFIVALLVAIDPFTAGVMAVAMGAIYLAMGIVSRRLFRRVSQRRAKLAGARIKAVQEGLGGLRDIILDQSQPLHQRRFDAINDEFRDLGARATIISTTPRFVVEAAAVALIGLLAIYLGHRPGGVLAAVPVLGALALGAQRLMPLLQASYQGIAQYLAMRHSLGDVLDLMAGPMLAATSEDATSEPVFQREIALAGASFRYGSGATALADIDLVIKRGERVGLIGPTGSGKSTLADIVMGLLVPTSGAILLDGRPLTPADTRLWQARIAHVPQSIFLVDDSMAANIAFGGADAIDMARVEAAARRAQIHDFIATLPDGYATPTGERGVRLSGGQRQRIGIARALYKQAEVLVFDEATSALDEATEAAVMAGIDALGDELTIVMIAHRRSTLRACGTVYRLDAGRIVERGDYATLVGAAPERAT